jgi:hypothetical protein
LCRAPSGCHRDTYFELLTEDAIYIGTDAGERWTVEEAETAYRRAIKPMAPDRRPIEALKNLRKKFR